MPTIFNLPILTLLQSGPKTPEQQVQRATSPLQQSVNGGQRISLPDFTAQPIQIKPIIPARDATGTVQSVQHNTHTDQVPTNVDERLKQNRQILGDVVETAIDFTPVIGDIKGLTWDSIKAGIEGGFGAGLSMAGLGLIGLAPGGSAVKISRRLGKDAKIMLDKVRDFSLPTGYITPEQIKEVRKLYQLPEDVLDQDVILALERQKRVLDGTIDAGQPLRKDVSKEIQQIISDNGETIKPTSLGGGEASVFIDGDRVLKVIGIRGHIDDNIGRRIYNQHMGKNVLGEFGEPLRFEGSFGPENNKSFIFSQRKINVPSLRDAMLHEKELFNRVRKELNAKGAINAIEDWWLLPNGIKISDVRPANVGWDEFGNIKIIDPYHVYPKVGGHPDKFYGKSLYPYDFRIMPDWNNPDPHLKQGGKINENN